MAFFAELIITVVKMVFLMAVAVLGVKAVSCALRPFLHHYPEL